ncbi:MAG: SDR family oxidoreductase [Desulfocapsaceae bacterium]|nr:SDR family oxidoreductase [Desulfocapsaceae bacterium]
MKRVLVAGATGYLGSYILKELQRRGLWVRTLVRDTDKLRLSNSVDVVEGLMTDPPSIERCCRNIDVVISTVGITRQRDGLTYMDVDYQANMNLLQEAKKNGVQKIIYISVLHGQSLQHLKICEAKERFVGELERSGMDFCVIRPNGFFSDMSAYTEMAGKGRVYLLGKGEHRVNPIHGADLATLCVDAIELDAREIDIGGPQTLSHNEIAKLAFQAVKKEATITYIPEWLRKVLLWSLRSFTTTKFHGPVEFFLTVMAMDMLAPEYGERTLQAFFEDAGEI